MKNVMKFESVAALADYADRTGRGELSRAGHRSEFCGHASFDETLDMARRGWPGGAAMAKRMASELPPPSIRETTHSATYYDTTGSYVDVDRYLEREPECMVEFMPDTRNKRFAKIVVSACYSAGFEVRDAVQRGVAIAATIDALEARNVRCEIELVTKLHGNGSGNDFTVHVALKRAEETLDLDALTFAVAHPAYLRRLVFAVMEQQGREFRKVFNVGHGYGWPQNADAIDDAVIFQTPNSGQDWSVEAARERVLAAVAEASK